MKTLRDRRVELQKILEDILGSKEVYFEPPANYKRTYPCIQYSRQSALSTYADNSVWLREQRYMITLISTDPDNPCLDKMNELVKCLYDRHYVAENLHHDVYNLYY